MLDEESLTRSRDPRADELRSLVQATTDKKDRELIMKIAREYDAMAAAMAVVHRA
jgi:crotonobetainyl-CoA:carnitine CoA-transferase CaiB-like acyl-CoA transferase